MVRMVIADFYTPSEELTSAALLDTVRSIPLDLELGDIVDNFLYCRDVGSFFLRDLAVEFFFDSHDELDSVQRVGAQIIHKGGRVDNLFLIHAQLGRDDLLDLVFDSEQLSVHSAADESRLWSESGSRGNQERKNLELHSE